MNPKKKKETRGGKRPNSGRKKSEIKTTTVSFRVEEKFVAVVKKTVKEKIEELKEKS